jgi:hypothetical protein
MKKNLLIIGILTASLTLVGCCSTTTATQSDQSSGALYVQTAQGGMLSSHTLRLSNVSQQTVWFLDRPARKYGITPTVTFIQFWNNNPRPDAFRKIAPNAVVLSISTHAGIPDQIKPLPVILSQPTYDVKKQVLTYQIQFLNSNDMPGQSQPLKDVSVFIDDGNPNATMADFDLSMLGPM